MKKNSILVAVMIVTIAMSGCSTSEDTESSSASTDKAHDMNAEALAKYVELEQSSIPQIMAKSPGVYSEMSVKGSFEDPSDEQLAPGEHAVMFYDFYANPVDWPSAIAALDAQRADLNSACKTAIFPAMRNAGISGPLGAQFSYDDGTSEFGPFWRHTCTEY